MKTLVIGGNSRDIGKTSLAASIIRATADLGWTAVKITQFGHGVCADSGEPCGCAVDDPECPYEISSESNPGPETDTARMLQAGASEALWARVAMGRLPQAWPAILERIAGREHVLFESNSVVDCLKPDAYLSVLDFDVLDFKASAARLLDRVDAFVLPAAEHDSPPWPHFKQQQLGDTPAFPVGPPDYCSAAVVDFVGARLFGEDLL